MSKDSMELKTSNYLDNNSNSNWEWHNDGKNVEIVTRHTNPKEHFHKANVTNVSIGDMVANPDPIIGQAHRNSAHYYNDGTIKPPKNKSTEKGKEMSKENTFKESLKVDKETQEKLANVAKNFDSSKKTISKDTSGREIGDEGPGNHGRESGLKTGTTTNPKVASMRTSIKSATTISSSSKMTATKGNSLTGMSHGNSSGKTGGKGGLGISGGHWEEDTVPSTLSNGNGLLMLTSGAQTSLDLKINLSEWDSHFLIFCIGNGLQIDQELLNILNGLGHYLLISENLIRSIKCTENSRLSPVELLSSMDCILISSIGTSGKYLLEMLPTYECERITNATDFSLHHDAPHDNRNSFHHRNGGGLRLSQSKHRESRSILIYEDLMELQDSNTMLIHNTHTSHTWVAKVTN